MRERPSLAPEDILVRMQPTPNPYALKFICNLPFKTEGKATFSSRYECQSMPLCQSLFDIAGVKQLHLFQNTLTISHAGELTEETMEEQVESVVKTRMPVHDPTFITEDEKEKQSQSKDRSNLSPEMQKIEEILDRTIRPGLRADGGDLDVISYEDNTLKILYQGACGGCPSAMMGTLDAIQGILQQEMQNPEIKVRPV